MAIFVIRNWDNDLNKPLSDAEQLLYPLLRHQQHQRLQQQNPSARELVPKSDDFTVSLDVQHFTPEEINVKVVDNFLEIEARHEERPDEHGFISRYFKRKYALPEGYNTENIVSKLSSDGVLTIRAPKIQEGPKERLIPIIHTGPHKAVEPQKREQKPEQ